MKKTLLHWQIAGFFFTAFAGILLHFLYDLTNQSVLVAPFSAINESIWEHLKLIFYPMFLFAIVESFAIAKDVNCYWRTKLIGISVAMVLVVTMFYTFRGLFGISPEWFNFVIYFVAIAIGFLLELWLFQQNSYPCKHPYVPLVILCFIALAFVVFTFIPPQIPLFMEE